MAVISGGRRGWSVAAILSAFAVWGVVQARQIRISTGEVVVDVNVTDSKGNPVSGLTEADFELFEDGIRQEIVSFRHISGEQVPSPLPPPGQAARPPELIASSISYPRLVSLAFDNINVERGGASRAADGAKVYVDKYLGKNVMMSVIGVGAGIHIYQRFTGDRGLLMTAIRDAVSGNTRLQGDVSAEIRTALSSISGAGAGVAGVTLGLDFQAMTDEAKIAFAYSADGPTLMAYPALQDLLILLKFRDIDQESRSNRTLAALLSIIEAQRVIPGRKSLIFLSSGFTLAPVGGRNMGATTELRAVTGAANRAGVTVYSIDVSGLRDQDPDADRHSAVDVAMKSRAIVGPNTSLGLLSNAVGLNTLENLQALAEETGGYAVANTNDLAGGMEQIGSYLEQYYVLTYMPSNRIADGRFRAVSVKLKRTRHRVRARNGYYALPDTDRSPLTGYEAAMLEKLNAKSRPSGFPIQVAGYSFPGGSGKSTAALYVNFPLSAFKFEERREIRDFLARADVMLLVRQADGGIVHRLSRQYDLQNSWESLETTRKKSFSFYRRVPLDPGEYILDAVVQDGITGKASVKTAELHVAVNDSQKLSLSGVVLGKDSPLIATTDAGDNPFRLPDPLRAEGSNVIPDLSGVYRKSSDKQLVVYFIVQPEKSAIACTLEFIRDGAPDLTLQRSLFDTAAMPIPCLTTVALDQLKVGKYELRVTARSGSESVSGAARFSIEP